MDVSEPDKIAPEPPTPCPPSVPQGLWDRVPESRRREALEDAAKNLRRAIHPEHSVIAFLERLGLAAPTKPVVAPEPFGKPRERPWET
jgi:hypothetical protein